MSTATVQFVGDIPAYYDKHLGPIIFHFENGTVYGNPMIADLQTGGINPDDVVAHIAGQLAARFGPAPARMPLEAAVQHSAQSLN